MQLFFCQDDKLIMDEILTNYRMLICIHFAPRLEFKKLFKFIAIIATDN